jgi:hypothetical protein
MFFAVSITTLASAQAAADMVFCSKSALLLLPGADAMLLQ